MKTRRRTCRAAWAMAICVCVLASVASAQRNHPGRPENPYEEGYGPRSVEGQITLQGPSSIVQPGGTSQVYSFRNAFSRQGVGMNEGTGPIPGPLFRSVDTTTHTILPSMSISPQTSVPVTGAISGSYSISGQPLGSPGATSSAPPPLTPTTRTTDVQLYSLDDQHGAITSTIAPRPLSPKVSITAVAAQSYMQVVMDEAEDPALTPDEITSLAPRQPGKVRDYMVNGEAAFREANYRKALENFSFAADLTNDSPEALLSLFHAQFATSQRGYYETAGHYLSQTLRTFPELPLVPLAPKEFWGQLRHYGEQLAYLEEHCQDVPTDAPALLILAYFHWFDGSYNSAAESLMQAYPAAHDEIVIEAIETFWDGMVASGKIDRELALPPRMENAHSGPLDPEDDEDEDVFVPIDLTPNHPDDVPLTP